MMTQEIGLDRLRVTLGKPQQVREAVGYLWFPSIARFPNGELMLTAILTADTHDNLVNAYCVSHSSDGGETWATFYDVAGWGGGCIPRIAQLDGSLAGPDFYVFPDPPGQARTFSGHFDRYEAGGRRFVRDPYALRVEGLPRDVRIHGDGGKWSKNWPANLVFYGSFVDLDQEVLTTTHLRYEGDDRYTQIALASADRGKTWRYLSTVAPSDTAPDAKEGPNESCVIRLADNDLMCVMRVGGINPAEADSSDTTQMSDHALLARTYSSDGGKTWSTVDRLPAPGVAPCLRRLSNEVLALTTGRPGLDLWLSDDPRGMRWQSIDLLDHHNSTLRDGKHHIRRGQGGSNSKEPYQTTSYTEFVEVSPGRLLLTYDRTPFGWQGVPPNSEERNRIYVMDVEVQRD